MNARIPWICLLLLLQAPAAPADEKVRLLCLFEHGTLEIELDYSRQTANGAPAMITDKEIVWTPGNDRDSLAIINRYTGVMQMSNAGSEFTGMCNKLVDKAP